MKLKVEHDFITDQELQLYSIAGGASLVFKKEAVGGAHIFRQPNSGFGPICDRVMFDALGHATLDGVRMRDVSAL
ncbi:hypothetical protein D3C86_1922670 [compost metagenome]